MALDGCNCQALCNELAGLGNWMEGPATSRRLHEWDHNDTTTNIIYIVIIFLLVMGSGLMSGLTLGLLSLDLVEVEVLKRSGTPAQRRNAAKIMPVIKDTHLLLVTLLLCNACCMEALPLFLDALVNEWQAILISVTAILVFGEIIPQSICKRHGLAIGAFLAWPVRILMVICSPVSWPLGKLLDWILEHEPHSLFRRKELKALVDMHGEDEAFGGKLSDDEVQIICGALDLTNKIAFLGMTPLNKVVMLSTDDKLDRPTLRMVLESGHSRLPVHEAGNKTHIIGLILTKDLLNYSLEDEVPVRCMRIRPLPRLSATTPMYDMLKLFRTGRSHMAVLTQPDAEGTDLRPLTEQMLDRSNRRRVSNHSSHNISINGDRAGSGDRPSRPSGVKPSSKSQSIGMEAGEIGAAGDAGWKAAAGGGEAGARRKGAGGPVCEGKVRMADEAAEQVQAPDVEAPEVRGDGSGGSGGSKPEGEVFPAAVAAAAADGGDDAPHVAVLMDGIEPNDTKDEPPAAAPEVHQTLFEKLAGPLRSRRARRTSDPANPRRRSSSSSGSTPSEGESEDGPSKMVPNIADPGTAIGIITIEDVIEELTGREILDETDHFADNERTIDVNEAVRGEMYKGLDSRMRAAISTNLLRTVRRISEKSIASNASNGRVKELLEATAQLASAASACSGPSGQLTKTTSIGARPSMVVTARHSMGGDT